MYKSCLKLTREEKGMSQSTLAKASGVPLRNIQAYEQGYKDINKAQVITVLQLAEALDCDVYDIINPRGSTSAPVKDSTNKAKVIHIG